MINHFCQVTYGVYCDINKKNGSSRGYPTIKQPKDLDFTIVYLLTILKFVTVYGKIGHNAACVDVAKRSI